LHDRRLRPKKKSRNISEENPSTNLLLRRANNDLRTSRTQQRFIKHKKYNTQNEHFLHKHPKQQKIMKLNNKQQDVFVKEGFFPDNFCDNDIPPVSTTTMATESSTPNYFDLKCNDVLCGPQGSNLHHPGNRLFLRLVNANKELYNKDVTRHPSFKRLLVLSIIAAIQKQGGQFVEKEEEGETWSEMSHKDACVKTAQALSREHSSVLSKSKMQRVKRKKETSPSCCSEPIQSE
jgi:hypothetical protein